MTPSAVVAFVKMSGAGNDFVLVDNRSPVLAESDKPAFVRRVARRKFGVGADGVILVEPPSRDNGADFAMRYFNADGSEGELCGNGTRCAAVFAREIGAAGRSQTFTTPAGLIRAEILRSPDRLGEGGAVRVVMARPGPIRRVRLTDVPGGEANLYYLRVGVPHTIEIVPEVRPIDVVRRGSAIRHHPEFPAGANANFIALDEASGEIRLRTFERGVEAECLACGTGATAAVAIAHRFHGWPAAAPVRMESGDVVHIALTGPAPVMEGPVTRVYDGLVPFFGPGA